MRKDSGRSFHRATVGFILLALAATFLVLALGGNACDTS